jgi:hypothetical protein
MNNHHDDLINSLLADLKPVRPMRTALFWAGAGVGLLLAAAFISVFYGFRPEIVALSTGTLPVHFTPIGKPLLFLVLGVTALWSVSKLNRPQNEFRIIHILPIIVGVSIAILNTAVEIATEDYVFLIRQLRISVFLCFATIICGGTIGQLVMWRFWLSKGASTFPTILAVMSGLASSSLMAFAYSLYCPMDAAVYIVLIYGTAVAIYTCFSTVICRHFLKW